MGIITNRYDFTILFDCENGNPNGDPDASGAPRIDQQTGLGIVTDVCIKRKIRNYISLAYAGRPGFDIYVGFGPSDNCAEAPLASLPGYTEMVQRFQKLKGTDPDADVLLREACAALYYDIRVFGGVVSSFYTENPGTVPIYGPVQLSYGTSIDPVNPQDFCITRVAITKESAEKAGEMGHKAMVPYALYRMDGSIAADLAEKLDAPNHIGGMTEDDLEVLWEAILNMFENDRSATRGKMAVQKLIIWKHESKHGNAPTHVLHDLIKVQRVDVAEEARCFSDYSVEVDTESLPRGVTVEIRD